MARAALVCAPFYLVHKPSLAFLRTHVFLNRQSIYFVEIYLRNARQEEVEEVQATSILSEDLALASHASQAAATFKLLSNEHRLLLLYHIANGEAHVSALVQKCGLPQSSVSQHLARLRSGGLVETRRKGTVIFYRLAHPSIHIFMRFLHAYFTQMRA